MISEQDFLSLSPKEQSDFLLDASGGLQSFIYTQQLTREEILKLVLTAGVIKDVLLRKEVTFNRLKNVEGKRVPQTVKLPPNTVLHDLFSSYSCCLYFTQPSTRTFTSFSLAAQSLGMRTEEIRDPNISSMYKGETGLDTLLTLSSLFDVIVMRQSEPSFIQEVAYAFRSRGIQTKLINAGSGSDQHPTQALLEIFTILNHIGLEDFLNECMLQKNPDGTVRFYLKENPEINSISSMGSIKGAMMSLQTRASLSKKGKYKIAMVGDLKRSRTVRSLSYLLSMFPEFEQIFVAPEEYQIKDDIITHLQENDISFRKESKLEDVVKDVDVLYMVRLQNEYSSKEIDVLETLDGFILSTEMVKSMKESSCILHPLPRRLEIPKEVDLDQRAKYWEAVSNGKYVRMALMMYMLGEAIPWKKVEE